MSFGNDELLQRLASCRILATSVACLSCSQTTQRVMRLISKLSATGGGSHRVYLREIPAKQGTSSNTIHESYCLALLS